MMEMSRLSPVYFPSSTRSLANVCKVREEGTLRRLDVAVRGKLSEHFLVERGIVQVIVCAGVDATNLGRTCVGGQYLRSCRCLRYHFVKYVTLWQACAL